MTVTGRSGRGVGLGRKTASAGVESGVFRVGGTFRGSGQQAERIVSLGLGKKLSLRRVHAWKSREH